MFIGNLVAQTSFPRAGTSPTTGALHKRTGRSSWGCVLLGDRGPAIIIADADLRSLKAHWSAFGHRHIGCARDDRMRGGYGAVWMPPSGRILIQMSFKLGLRPSDNRQNPLDKALTCFYQRFFLSRLKDREPHWQIRQRRIGLV